MQVDDRCCCAAVTNGPRRCGMAPRQYRQPKTVAAAGRTGDFWRLLLSSSLLPSVAVPAPLRHGQSPASTSPFPASSPAPCSGSGQTGSLFSSCHSRFSCRHNRQVGAQGTSSAVRMNQQNRCMSQSMVALGSPDLHHCAERWGPGQAAHQERCIVEVKQEAGQQHQEARARRTLAPSPSDSGSASTMSASDEASDAGAHFTRSPNIFLDSFTCIRSTATCARTGAAGAPSECSGTGVDPG